jgi:hypothetical protein
MFDGMQGISNSCCGLKRSRVFSQESAKPLLGSSKGIVEFEFSNLVFTSLSDAIEAWEAAAKVHNHLEKFNMVATVLKWSLPKRTKGNKFQN